MALLGKGFRNSIQGWMMCMMVVVCLLSVLSSCSKDEEPAVITPSAGSEVVFNEGINFNSSGGEKEITFTTNKDWSIVVSALDGDTGWCTVSPSQGKAGENTVNIRVFKSEVPDSRSATLSLTANELTKDVLVTQDQKDVLLLTSSNFEVPAEGGIVEVEVKANVRYWWGITGVEAQWIHEGAKNRGLTTETVVLSIDKSDEYDQRVGNVNFHSMAYGGETITQVVKIIQKGRSILTIPQKEYTLSDAGGTITIEVQSNFEPKVKMPQVDWITPVSTKGNRSFAYSVAPNTTLEKRKAEIVYYDEKKTIEETVTIIQEPLSLLINEQSTEIMIGGQKQLSYKKNSDIDDTSLVWSSSDESVATVTQEGLVTAVARGKATITLTAPGGITANCEVVVYQFTDKINLRVLGNGTYINGYIIGDGYSEITNNSTETIYLKTLEIYDGSSGKLVGYNDNVDKYLSPGESTNLGMSFDSVYLPIFVWTFTANGVEYEVTHQYPKPFGK